MVLSKELTGFEHSVELVKVAVLYCRSYCIHCTQLEKKCKAVLSMYEGEWMLHIGFPRKILIGATAFQLVSHKALQLHSQM